MMLRLSILLVVAVLSHGVDRSKFKTCDQSGFCRRSRKYVDSDVPNYLIMPESLTVSEKDGLIRCTVLNTKYNADLKLEIKNIENDISRITVVESEPLHPRYVPLYALDGEPAPKGLTTLSKGADGAKFRMSDSVDLVVQFNPIKFEFVRNGKVVVVVNSKRLFYFEHYRTKPVVEGPQDEPKPEVDNEVDTGEDADHEEKPAEPHGTQLDQEVADGMWEESFQSHHDTKKRGPSAVGVDVSFPGSLHVYGIPEHAGSFSLRDTDSSDPYRLFNLDVFEYEIDDVMALYGSVPLAVSHSVTHGSAAVFWHNAAETWVDVRSYPRSGVLSAVSNYLAGDATSPPEKNVRWMSESGALDLFVLSGPTPAAVASQYRALTGATQLPPLFALGYHQCRWNYNDQQDVLQVQATMDRHQLPFDVIWLDIEHTDGKKYFTWHPHNFPTPTDMINSVAARGRKMVAIIDPHIKRESGYVIHDDAVARGYYVKNSAGDDFDGWCWPGSSGYLDFYSEHVQQYWTSRFQLDTYVGSTLDLFTWNDMNEPSVFSGPEVTMPKDAQHVGGWEHRDVHNEYGMLAPMCTARGQVQRSGGRLRPFVLTRAAFAGSQRFGAKWTGDNTADWAHLRASLPMLLSSSVAGVTFNGADIGGFFGNPDAELLTRWYQAAAYQPFFRAHAHIDTRRREPYLFDATTVARIRAALRSRYRLLPLWYTLFYENELTGMPPMRAMWMQFPDDADSLAVQDQYMLGDALLVHPQTQQGGASVDVYFPGGVSGQHTLWYEFESAAAPAVHRAGTVQVATSLDTVPVFQRGGSIVPLQQRPRRSSAAMLHDPYTLVAAVDANGTASGSLYMDDGHTFDYRHADQFALMALTLRDGGRVLNVRRVAGAADYRTDRWIERVVVLGLGAAPHHVLLHETASGEQRALPFKFDPGADRLVVRKPGVNATYDWTMTIS